MDRNTGGCGCVEVAIIIQEAGIGERKHSPSIGFHNYVLSGGLFPQRLLRRMVGPSVTSFGL